MCPSLCLLVSFCLCLFKSASVHFIRLRAHQVSLFVTLALSFYHFLCDFAASLRVPLFRCVYYCNVAFSLLQSLTDSVCLCLSLISSCVYAYMYLSLHISLTLSPCSISLLIPSVYTCLLFYPLLIQT